MQSIFLSISWLRCEQSTLFPYSFSFWPSFSYHGMSKGHKGSNSYKLLSTEGYLPDVYIDDFYGVEKTELAGIAFNRMTEWFKEQGLAASPAKY